MSESLRSLDSWHCFACGPSHPKGLRLSFTVDGERVRTEFTADDDYTGTGSIVHGGIVATVFDEVMSWTLLRFTRKLHLTARMEQRFRRPTPAGVPLVAEGWIENARGRGLVEVAARMYRADAPDELLAESSGVYIEAPADILESLDDVPRREMAEMLAAFDQPPSS